MAENFLDKTKTFSKTSLEKLKSQNKGTKIALIIGTVGIITAGTYMNIEHQNDKYAILFSDLDSQDATVVTKELETQKIDIKIKGNSIYVPKEMVDKLRLEMSSNISGGSNGYELMDSGSSFGMTSDEFDIKKQRMAQGELEKTIKSFPQISNCRVHITQSDDSVFATDKTPGKAAVYVELKAGQSLSESQIKSIISLVSGSQKNMPKQNIEVVDQNMTLLSENLYDENGNARTSNSNTIFETQDAEKRFNSQLERSVLDIVEPIFGEGKVKVKINANLDFDSQEKTEIKIDPEKVIVSETISKSSSVDKEASTNSPVDNNMSNTTEQKDGSTQESSEEIRNYELGKTETHTINAPGEVKRLTASVALHGNLSPAQLKNVENLVSSAIGLDATRGDSISVVNMKFNDVIEAEKNKTNETNEKDNLLKMSTALLVSIPIVGVIIILLLLLIKKKKKQKEEELLSTEKALEIDMLQSKLDNLQKEDDKLRFISMDNEEKTLEDEVKIYATEKPEQVAEIIKTWLNDVK